MYQKFSMAPRAQTRVWNQFFVKHIQPPPVIWGGGANFPSCMKILSICKSLPPELTKDGSTLDKVIR